MIPRMRRMFRLPSCFGPAYRIGEPDQGREGLEMVHGQGGREDARNKKRHLPTCLVATTAGVRQITREGRFRL